MTPPIRFLALVVGGWTAARIIALLPQAHSAAAPPIRPQARMMSGPVAGTHTFAVKIARRPPSDRSLALEPAPPAAGAGIDGIGGKIVGARSGTVWHGKEASAATLPEPAAPLMFKVADAVLPRVPHSAVSARSPLPANSPDAVLASQPRANARFTGSVWMLARRRGDEATIASDGLLGGSQAGGRLLYRVNADAARPLSLSARLASPLRRNAMEAALGIEWQPLAGMPVRVLAERRQRIAGEGRSAFALLAHGGVSERPVAAGLRLDAYAQGGVVGIRRRDLFVDGGATLVRPLADHAPHGLAVGAGVWAGAQPGASRVDIGPRLTTTLGAEGVRARISLDWRFRIAGGAAPSSGPSLTVGSNF